MPFNKKELEVIIEGQLSYDEYHILIDKILLDFDFEKCYKICLILDSPKYVKSIDDLIKCASYLLFEVIDNNYTNLTIGCFSVNRLKKGLSLEFNPVSKIEMY